MSSLRWGSLILACAVVTACALDFDVFRGELPPATGGSSAGGSGGNGGGNGGNGGTSSSCMGPSDCQSGFCDEGTCAACVSAADCAPVPDSWCNPDAQGGSCEPKVMNGDGCPGDDACLSGSCVDDMCCDSACAGTCMACAEALTGQPDGTCANVLGGFNPNMACPMDQACDGVGSCATFCGLQPTPPGGSCPAECTGGCNAGTCTIDCGGASQCANAAINCPPGFACLVQCGGTQSCDAATISCPNNYACDVSCTGQTGCRGAVINCSQVGACDLSCGSASNACRDTSLLCGTNACAATCNGSNFLPVPTCGSSCNCTTC